MRGVIGPSAHQALHRAAWFMARRIRRALAPESFNAPLSGTVEADETYIGDKAKGKQGRGAANKPP